jgi:hypothetical protein
LLCFRLFKEYPKASRKFEGLAYSILTGSTAAAMVEKHLKQEALVNAAILFGREHVLADWQQVPVAVHQLEGQHRSTRA